MREVDADEAGRRLSTLLDAAASGQTIVITRRGKPVARLVPAVGAEEVEEVAAVIARMKAARQARGCMSTAELIGARDEGRR
jgi:prevent-host-death family protein